METDAQTSDSVVPGQRRRSLRLSTTMLAALAASIASIGLATPTAAFSAPGTSEVQTSGCGQLVSAFVAAERAEGTRGRGFGRSISLFVRRAC